MYSVDYYKRKNLSSREEKSMQENKQQLYCFIRNAWVFASPEEYIRQATLKHLLDLGFSSSSLAVEKELKSMVDTSSKSKDLPDRRLDIVCYSKNSQEGLYPLLLIECKAVPISSKELRQVIGYNHYLKAPFIALINQNEKRLGWFDPQLSDYKFINYIPKHSELVSFITH